MSMSRAPARPRDGKPVRPRVRRSIDDARRPQLLTRENLELPDGRYLLAYGHAPIETGS